MGILKILVHFLRKGNKTINDQTKMKERILLIDDEETFANGLAVLLEKKGFQVKTAKDGKEGLECIQKQGFDIVVTDILMPDKDGVEVITELSKKETRPKIIAISGGGRIDATNYLEMAKKFGVEEILHKPFSVNELVTKLEALTIN